MHTSFKKTARELQGLQETNPIQLHAASLSLNLLFSLFPLLLVMVSLFGVLYSDPDRIAFILQNIQPFIPSDVLKLVSETFLNLMTTSPVGLFSVGFLLLLWSASRTTRGITYSLDNIYHNHNQRNRVLKYTIALTATFILGILFFVASNILIFGNLLAEWLTSQPFIPLELSFLLTHLQWPLLFFIILDTFLLAYRFIPNHDQKTTWKDHLPGALTATTAWIFGSLLFNLYLSSTSRFEMYGIIGIFIVLILYIQLVSYAFLVGAYLNRAWKELQHRNWFGRVAEGLTGVWR